MALSRMQIDAYEADGIVHPLRGLEPDEARAFIPAQQDLEARLRAGWYVAAGARRISGPDSVTPVRGRDHGNFRLESPPDEDFSQAAVAAWLAALEFPSGLGRSAKRASAAG